MVETRARHLSIVKLSNESSHCPVRRVLQQRLVLANGGEPPRVPGWNGASAWSFKNGESAVVLLLYACEHTFCAIERLGWRTKRRNCINPAVSSEHLELEGTDNFAPLMSYFFSRCSARSCDSNVELWR